MEQFIFAVPLLSFVSALLVALIRDDKVFPKLSTYITFLAFLVSLAALVMGDRTSVLSGLLELYGDNLGLLLSTYILLVSLVVHKFSEKYMADEEGYRRFYILLDLMTGVLVLLVLSANLLTLLVAWHLMGLLLYLLLNQNHRRPQALRYANLTFFTHRLADVPLFVAVVLLYREFGTLSLPEISEKVLHTDSGILPVVTLLITLSAMLKSAQFLFHHWIVYSMEGPTPVSALMHAGIVNAGAFLVNRFAPLYVHDKLGLTLAFIAGSVTAIVGSVLMLLQTDIKKSLGYSTVGQMGYMVMELGVGALALAVYHMMAHGIFKATLFLYSGSVIHSARHDPNIPEDEVYRTLTRKEEVVKKVPWFLYGIITVAVPLLIVFFTHYIFEEKILEYKTSLIILFFGWVTAAQVLVSVFRLGREKPILTAFLAILSLLVVMTGYVLIGHSLQSFLYDEALVERIYEVAFTSWWVFLAEVLFMGAVVLIGWIFIYYASREKFLPVYLNLYTHFSRELYIHDVYDLVKGWILRFISWISRKTAIPAGALVFGGFALGDFESKTLLLPILALLLPLFPLSLVTSKLVDRLGSVAIALFPIVGIFLLRSYEPDAWVRDLALFTLLFHSLRILSVRNIRAGASELYSALLGLTYLSEKAVLLAVLPLALMLLSNYLRKTILTDEIYYTKGLMIKTPLLSTVLVLVLVLSYTLPLFLYELPKSPLDLVLFTLGWFSLGLSTLTNLGRVLWGEPRKDTVYRDLWRRG